MAINTSNTDNSLVEGKELQGFFNKISREARAYILATVLSVGVILSSGTQNASAQELSHLKIPSQGVTVELNGGGHVTLFEQGGEYNIKGDNSSQNGTDSFEGTVTIDGTVFTVVSNSVENGGVSIYNDLLLKCDSNGDGKINTKSDWKKGLVSKEVAKKEHKCELRYDIAQLDKENAQLDKENAQLDKENAQLDKENAQLDKENTQLDKENAQGRKRIAQLDKEGEQLDKEGEQLDKEGEQKDKRINELKQEIIHRLSK